MPETVTLGGFPLRFELHGEGIPVVYTPGAFFSLESSRVVAEALVPVGYQVLLWDRPNTGASGLLFEPQHYLRQWADKLDVLLEHVGWSAAYIAGVINGLLASLHFATWYPDRVRGLVLVAAPTGDHQWWQAVAEATFLEPARVIEKDGMAAALALGDGHWGVFDWPEQFDLAPHKREQLLTMEPAKVADTLRAWSDGYLASGRVWAGGLTDEQLGNLTAPAIVFSGPGELSRAYPFHGPEDARRLHHALPRSELVISSECLGARWPRVLEQVEQEGNFDPLVAALAARIDEFIRSCGG